MHFLTFDIEHWFEGYRYRGLSGWENMLPKDHIIVQNLFSLLAEHDQNATFFFTGRFAKDHPWLVRMCADLGHEVASHSYDHQLITGVTGRDQFREDLRASLDILGELCGKAVLGYRAPKWSVTAENQHWVLPILAEEGLLYDSSFFPAIGGVGARQNGEPIIIELSEDGQLIEIPASGFRLARWTVPVGGGLYFRAYPAWATLLMLNQKEGQGQPGMVYLHPYDLDTSGPNISGGGILFNLFRTYGISQAWNRLDHLLKVKNFNSIAGWIASNNQELPRVSIGCL